MQVCVPGFDANKHAFFIILLNFDWACTKKKKKKKTIKSLIVIICMTIDLTIVTALALTWLGCRWQRFGLLIPNRSAAVITLLTFSSSESLRVSEQRMKHEWKSFRRFGQGGWKGRRWDRARDVPQTMREQFQWVWIKLDSTEISSWVITSDRQLTLLKEKRKKKKKVRQIGPSVSRIMLGLECWERELEQATFSTQMGIS